MSRKAKEILKENGRKFKQLSKVEWNQDSSKVNIILKDDILKSAGKIMFFFTIKSMPIFSN
jgi:hypothetical protein